MNPDARRNALTSAQANLLWLALDSHYPRACAILHDSDLQAAIVRAQNPEGATKPTEGSTAWSDPTGTTALRDATTELRATEIRRVWLRELSAIDADVHWLRATIADARGEPAPLGPPGFAPTLRHLAWLTEAPHDRARGAHVHTEGETLAEIDHAIGWVHDRTRDLRSGTMTTSNGKRVPSVHAVLESARKVTELAPPPPVQKPIGQCDNCARYGVNADAPHGGLCAPCVRFRSENKCLPRAMACREQDRRGLKARYSAAMIEEAKGSAKVRAGRARVS